MLGGRGRGGVLAGEGVLGYARGVLVAVGGTSSRSATAPRMLSHLSHTLSLILILILSN